MLGVRGIFERSRTIRGRVFVHIAPVKTRLSAGSKLAAVSAVAVAMSKGAENTLVPAALIRLLGATSAGGDPRDRHE
jgi:hypothetical protein